MKRETVLDVTLLRLHLANKTQPEDGLFLAEHFYSLQLDYSDQSLHDLNQFLIQLYNEGYRTEYFISPQSHANLLIMIAIYLCDTISYRTNEKSEWFNYYEATARLPKEYALPQGFFSSIVALINHQVCLPFLVIEDLLSTPHENSRNCVSYVTERCISISKTKVNNPNELCKAYLNALEECKMVPGGNFYKAATDHIEFDYSSRSIEEIDRLLFCIREHEKLSAKDYEQFIQQPDKANFLLLIAFYLGMTIARHSCLPIQWYNFEDYLNHFSHNKKTKYRFDIHHIFSMRNQLYYPLQFLKEFLFTEQLESMNCLEYIELSIPRQLGFIQRFPYRPASRFNSNILTNLQRKAFYDAGYLAAYALYIVLDHDHYVPTISTPSPEGPSHLMRLESNFPELEGLDLMQNNPEHKPYQIYSEDSYAYLDTGRTDAIHIEIRSYVAQSFKLSLVIPYQAQQPNQPAKHFNVVRYSESALSEGQIEAGIAEFYESAFQFVSPITQKSLWQQFFDPQEIQIANKQPASKDFLLLQQRKFKLALSQMQPLKTFRHLENHDIESSLYKNPFQHIKIQQEILRLTPKDRRYLQVDVPNWLLGDELYKQVLAMPTLYQHGRIVWGCIVHTQDSMYYPGDEHGDGDIIYDPTGRTDPKTLESLAQRLIGLKGMKAKSTDQFHYIQHLSIEHSRISDLPYPASLSDLSIRISSIWFYRNHLPNGILAMPYFPILICDDDKYRGQVMVLPAWFWPKHLHNEWLNISKPRLNKYHDLSSALFQTAQHSQNNKNDLILMPDLSLIYPDFEVLQQKQYLLNSFFKAKLQHLPLAFQMILVMLIATILTAVAVF